ncbi:MAG: isoamylase [Treponema sp.]|jgi:hypothetical protein|nr:isoamylase [Treponema sp.]
MKRIVAIIVLAVIAGFSHAADWESYQLIDRLLTLPGPGEPVIFEDSVIFTASSGLRRVGVAFAHENFSKVYWFQQLVIPQDQMDAPIPPGKIVPDPYIDSGIQFHIQRIPENAKSLEYRLIINGLWTIDPANSRYRKDPVSGLVWSILPLPQIPSAPDPLKGLPAGLDFLFNGPPGEVVTIAGDFNGWDPFMYELKEGPSGVYNITIPLPAGKYQYVFFHKGRRYVDPNNPTRIYARDGSAASEIIVP